MNDSGLKSQLSGVWRLMSYEARASDGSLSYPLGPNPLGIVIYTSTGYMSVQIMSSGRSRFCFDGLHGGSSEELGAAAAGYLAYSGRFEVNNAAGTVMHEVTVSLLPNLIGTKQVRSLKLDGNRLELSAGAILLAGSEQSARLVWERIG